MNPRKKSPASPPNEIAIRWCRRCGRDDRVMTLPDKHYTYGKLCGGKVLTLVYMAKTIWSSQWEDEPEPKADLWDVSHAGMIAKR